MTYSSYLFEDHIGVKIVVHKWTPDTGSPKAGVYIAHGMAEHALRYDFFAEALANAGYVVYADDHRGHGQSIEEGKVGHLYKDGWIGVIKDIEQIITRMKQDHANIPIFFFGHSWGSLLGQDYMQLYPNEVDGIIFSGSLGEQAMLGSLLVVAKLIIAFKGRDTEAGLIYKLGIEPFRKPFLEEGSDNAWISSLKEEVEKYDADPLCGFKPTNAYLLEMGQAMKRMWSKKNEARISLKTPIYLLGGSNDIVSQSGKTLQVLYDRYKKLGIKDLKLKFYEGSRHEPLNDISRQEMITDCISWLDTHI